MATETKPAKWEVIEAAAKELGVSDEALRKWAARGGVPGKWQVPLIVQTNGRLGPDDFLTGDVK